MKKLFLLKALMSAALFINTPLWSSDIIAPSTTMEPAPLDIESLSFVREYTPKVKSYLAQIKPCLEKLESEHGLISTLLTDIEKPQTPNTLWHLILRAQAAQSVGRISPQEFAFYQTLKPLDQFVEKLLHQNAWATKETSEPVIDEFMKFTPNLTMVKDMNNSSGVPVPQDIKLIPCLNTAFLKPREILKSIINEEYLVGVPRLLERKLKAHGIDNMSPLGFTLHDLTHGLFNERPFDLNQHVWKILSNRYESVDLVKEAVNAHNMVLTNYLLV